MASQKQIDANKRNAQKSTGPVTEKGKSVSRMNAKRDGLTGQILTLSDEDRPIFEKLKSEMIAGLAPKTTMELSLANSIAWDTWRLNHLRAVEMNLYALGAEGAVVETDNPQIHTAMAAAMTFSNESDKFVRMSLYEQRMNRSLHKNLETLRKLQAERKATLERERAEEVILARYSDIKGLAYQPPATFNANGSVFSTHEIFAAANRVTTLQIAQREIYSAAPRVQFAGASSGQPSNVVNWPEPDAA